MNTSSYENDSSLFITDRIITPSDELTAPFHIVDGTLALVNNGTPSTKHCLLIGNQLQNQQRMCNSNRYPEKVHIEIKTVKI